MNNEMILTANRRSLDSAIARFANLLNRPVILLSNYYSQVLERRIDTRQTWCLLNVQLAFFLTVFPACSLLLRVACMAWLVSALLKCKSALQA